MFWDERTNNTFDLAFALSAINEEDLKILSESKKSKYYEYITSGNSDITDEEVRNYILESFPILANYMHLGGKISILDYEDIFDEINGMLFKLKPIRQDLDFLQYDESLPSRYRKVYLSEEEQDIYNPKEERGRTKKKKD